MVHMKSSQSLYVQSPQTLAELKQIVGHQAPPLPPYQLQRRHHSNNMSNMRNLSILRKRQPLDTRQ